MLDKTLVTYPDGSEFTIKYALISVVAGAALGAAAVTIKEWRSNRQFRRAVEELRRFEQDASKFLEES